MGGIQKESRSVTNTQGQQKLKTGFQSEAYTVHDRGNYEEIIMGVSLGQ